MADANSIAMDPRVKDLTGHPPFGRLTVVRYDGSIDGNAQWLCRCECGSECSVAASELTRRTRVSTKSCGCHMREKARQIHTTHGQTLTPTYQSWRRMLQRCYRQKARGYHRYGGRGITVCERWRTSFEAFFADMGEKPSGHRISIERLNNDGNYEQGNCVWATPLEQSRNKSTTVRMTFDGRTQCLAAWCQELGIAISTIWNRLNRGWSVERALTTPARHCRASASSATPSL